MRRVINAIKERYFAFMIFNGDIFTINDEDAVEMGAIFTSNICAMRKDRSQFEAFREDIRSREVKLIGEFTKRNAIEMEGEEFFYIEFWRTIDLEVFRASFTKEFN